MVKINGKQFDAEGKSIYEYLISSGYDIKRVAVELNGEILPKTEFENTFFKNDDKLEVVSFVGGG